MSPRWNKRLKPAFFKFVACEMKKINNRFFESLCRKTLVNITRCSPHWHIYLLFRFDIIWIICISASIAQWQSTGLVNQGSRVQSSLEAWRARAHRFMWQHRASWFWKFCRYARYNSPFSSVVEHWSRKPGVESSILSGGSFLLFYS